MFSGSRSNILSALSYLGRLACRFRKFFFPFLVALSVSLASAQPLLHFRNVDGLSQQMVYNMHLDKKGFLWISTSDGLNRYDGSTMRVYRPENDSHVPGLGGCIIRSRILEDSTGKLWLSTENGVYFFSPRTEKFYPVSFSYKGRLKRIASEPIAIAEGKIWLYNGWLGLFCYSPHQGTLRSYGSPQSGAAEIINPIEFHFDGREIIYAATRQGVYSFNLKNGAWEVIISLKECRALTLMQDTLYVSHENGVKYISMRSKTDGVMGFSESYNGPIRCFFADSNGHLWAGDNGGGIWLKRKGMPLFERAGFPGKFSGTANGFSVYSISGINGRVLFAGGDVFGLKVADLHKPVFQNYPSVNAEDRITPVFITGIAGHSNGTIFAGTMGEGFLHKPAGRETFSRFPVPGFLNEKTVRTSAMNDEKGNVSLPVSNAIADIYSQRGMRSNASLLKDSFVHSAVYQELLDGNSKIIERLKLIDCTDYLAVGKIYFALRPATSVEGVTVCTATISVSLISTMQKSVVKSFAISANGNGVTASQAQDEAILKLMRKYQTDYSSI